MLPERIALDGGGGIVLRDWIIALAVLILAAYLSVAGYTFLKSRENYAVSISLRELKMSFSPVEPACGKDGDCGKSMYVGQKYCKGDSVMRDRLKPTCLSPGQANASCVNRTEEVMARVCRGEREVCSRGECVNITCTNSVWDLGEIGVDCGGDCIECSIDSPPFQPTLEKCTTPGDDMYQRILEVEAVRYGLDFRENVSINKVSVTYGRASEALEEYEGFLAAIVNSHGTVICAEYLPLRNKDAYTLMIPYRTSMEKLVVTRDNVIVAEKKIVGCNENGFCEPELGETYLACVTDCKDA
ncbi:MAG: hypothetical protein ABH834_00650 [Candidatus Altiarchaeota archaeon]